MWLCAVSEWSRWGRAELIKVKRCIFNDALRWGVYGGGEHVLSPGGKGGKGNFDCCYWRVFNLEDGVEWCKRIGEVLVVPMWMFTMKIA